MPILRRTAGALLRLAVRIAPEESRIWGEAMLHELDYIEGDLAALSWALGGASVLCRHSLTHAHPLRRLEAVRFPRRTRLLLAAAALLILLGAVAMSGHGLSSSSPANGIVPCGVAGRHNGAVDRVPAGCARMNTRMP